MKKTLSIILCLSLLISTFSFAFPAIAMDMSQIGVESGEELADAELFGSLQSESDITFDFTNPDDREGVSVSGNYEYTDYGIKMLPTAGNDDLYVCTPIMGVKAADYGKAEVLYDAEVAGSDNKMTVYSQPALYFTYTSAESAYAGNRAGKVINAEEVTIDGRKYVKYTYNLQSNANWSGEIARLRADPYNGYPVWGVRYIKLISNEVVDDAVSVTGITAPETWAMPDTEASVQEGFEVVSVTWDGEKFETGEFKPGTVYTVVIKVAPPLGYRFTNGVTATIDGTDATATYNEADGTLTVSYTYPETASAKDVSVAISGPEAITEDGGSVQYTASVTAEGGADAPNTAVVWSVENEDGTAKPYATISEDGVLKAIRNGSVVVTATSVYNSNFSDTKTVVLSNQSDEYTVTYSANTTSEVTNLPAAEAAKAAYTLASQIPQRTDGYAFLGWSTKPVSDEIITGEIRVTEDITLYAQWFKGISYDMDSKPSNMSVNLNSGETATYENGVMKYTTGKYDHNFQFKFTDGQLKADDVSKIEVRIKAALTEGAATAKNDQLAIYYTTKKDDGEYFSGPWAYNGGSTYNKMYASTYSNVGCKTNGEEYTKIALIPQHTDKYEVDASTGRWSNSWDGWKHNLETIRLDMPTVKNKTGAKIHVEIDYIRFYSDNIIESYEITGIDAPVAKAEASTTATTAFPKGYEVSNITWSPALVDGRFDFGTAYTAKVELAPTSGWSLSSSPVSATIDGNDAKVETDADGKVYLSYKFPETEKFQNVSVSVSGPATISEDNAEVQYTAAVTAEDGSEAPNTEVVWSIENVGNPAKPYATISKDGVLKAMRNGAVILTATSVYDSTKSATFNVTVSGQSREYNIVYNANTTATVSNMPENDAAKGGTYTLSDKIPTRNDGYRFCGWTTEPVSDDFIIGDIDLDSDVTLYAYWYNGTSLDMNSKPSEISGTSGINLSTTVFNGSMKFTSTNSAPQIHLKFTNGRISADDVSKIELRFKATNEAGNPFSSDIAVYYSTIKDNGEYFSGPWAYNGGSTYNTMYASTYNSTRFTTTADGYITVTIVPQHTDNYDVNEKGRWPNCWDAWKYNLDTIRFDLGSVSGSKLVYDIDYIRFYSNSLAETYKVTGIDTPVAKAEAPKTATTPDASKYYVSNITWEPELIGDRYFNGNTQYTAKVELAPAGGWVLTDKPVSATINGKTATVTKSDTDGRIVLSYTFPGKTEDVGEIKLSKVNLVSNNGTDTDTQSIAAFVGDEFQLWETVPELCGKGMRWLGWSESQDASTGFVYTHTVTEQDATFYAIYDKYDSFDFSNPYHYRTGISASQEGIMNFVDDTVRIVPLKDKPDAYFIVDVPGIIAADYGCIEVLYDAELAGSENKFTTGFEPVLYFTLESDPSSFAGTKKGTIVAAQEVTVGGRKYIKYTYDVQANENWTGAVAKLRFDPYDGDPQWAVRAVNFIPNEVNEDAIVITDITKPATWITPDIEAKVDSSHKVVSVSWSGEKYETGEFKPETAYTVNVKVAPITGYKFPSEGITATVDSNDAVTTYNADGTITVSYTYPETLPLKEFTVKVSGAAKILKDSRAEKYTAAISTALPNTSVIWSVEDENGEATNIATISQDGKLTPIRDGVVYVVATSVYNPEIQGKLAVTIGNQNDEYTVTYDKNTGVAVTGIPEAEPAKGAYAVSKAVPERETNDGFVFAGWSTSPTSNEVVSEINVKADTTLYATWVKGTVYTMDSKPSNMTGSGLNVNTAVYDGKMKFTSTNSTPQLHFKFTNGLISAEKVSKIELRIKITDENGNSINSNLGMYYSTIKEDGTYFSGPWAYNGGSTYNKMYGSTYNSVGYTSSRDGFITLTITPKITANESVDPATGRWSNCWDAWKYNLDSIRFDLGSVSSGKLIVEIDSIGFYDENNEVILDANGGTFENGEETKTVPLSKGNTTISATPTKENNKFVGWSKTSDGSGEVYTTNVPITDNSTLYAIWNPSVSFAGVEEVDGLVSDLNGDMENVKVEATSSSIKISTTAVATPVIKIADELTITENTKTMLISMKYSYKSLYNSNTAELSDDNTSEISDSFKLRFTSSDGETHDVVLVEAPAKSSKSQFITVDVTDEWFDGTITDVKMILSTGVLNSCTISEIVFTDETTAEEIKKAYFASQADSEPTISTGTGDRKVYPVIKQDEEESEEGKTDDSTSSETTEEPSVPIIERTAGIDPIFFEFESKNDLKLFDTIRRMQVTSNEDGILSLKVLGYAEGTSNAPALTTTELALNADTHKYVVIRGQLDVSTSANVKIYFRTEELGYSETRTKTVEITDYYSVVACDMSTCADWYGTITGIFISLTGNARGTFDIDYIGFSDEIPEDKAVSGTAKFAYVNEYADNQFTDVKKSDWYSEDVEKSYKMGFMNGTGETTFDPNGSVTVAQAITIASRIHATYYEATISEPAEGEAWYTPYVNYALDNGIIYKKQFDDVTAVATRRDVASVLAYSVPAEWLTYINMFSKIPDVPTNDLAFNEILTLYCSGVIVGVDDEYNFLPDNDIKRSEVSAIINRIASAKSRKRVVTQEEIDSIKVRYEVKDIMAASTLGGCTDTTPSLKGGYAYGSAKDLGSGKGDPCMTFGAPLINIDTSVFKTIRIGLKCDGATPDVSIYFKPETGNWSESTNVRGVAEGTPDENGFVTYSFACSSNSNWVGTIPMFRIDPFNTPGEFYISFVEFTP